MVLIVTFSACNVNPFLSSKDNISNSTDNDTGGDNGTTGGDNSTGGDNGTTGGDNSTGGDNGTTGGDNSTGGDNGTGNNPFDPPPSCAYQFNTKPATTLLAGTSNGIFYSKDNGMTWLKSTMPVGSKSKWISLADLGNNVVLAGSGEDVTGLGIIGNPGYGILKSTDGGITWQRTDMKSGQWSDILHVGNGVVIAGSNTSDIGGVWRSTNYGDTWAKNIDNGKGYNYFTANNPANSNGITYGFVTAFGRVDNCTIIVAKNMPVTGISSNLFHLSIDGGKTWFRIFEPLYEANRASKFLLHKSGRISVALNSFAGIALSSQLGNSWEGKSATKYSFGTITQSKKTNTVIAGSDNVDVRGLGGNVGDAMHGGLWRSSADGGLSTYSQVFNKYFWMSSLGLDNGSFIAGCRNASDTHAGFQCSGTYISNDDGITWQPINNAIKSLSSYVLIDVR